MKLRLNELLKLLNVINHLFSHLIEVQSENP